MTISLLRNDEQKIVANGYPDLRIDRILGGSIEGLDVQMLLDPFEEEFILQALAVQFCNGQWIFNREVVGQEAIDFPFSKSSYTTSLSVSGYFLVEKWPV